MVRGARLTASLIADEKPTPWDDLTAPARAARAGRADGQRMCMPEMARAITSRWISDVPLSRQARPGRLPRLRAQALLCAAPAQRKQIHSGGKRLGAESSEGIAEEKKGALPCHQVGRGSDLHRSKRQMHRTGVGHVNVRFADQLERAGQQELPRQYASSPG